MIWPHFLIKYLYIMKMVHRVKKIVWNTLCEKLQVLKYVSSYEAIFWFTKLLNLVAPIKFVLFIAFGEHNFVHLLSLVDLAWIHIHSVVNFQIICLDMDEKGGRELTRASSTWYRRWMMFHQLSLSFVPFVDWLVFYVVIVMLFSW